ncbi:Uncharacterised protein [Mycobacteroides abscessus subsp. abscessus]|uniref:hypothetical protein n=1 Tax=Mycobacteroides abscessus TaxID=36809 RepID=UPI0009A81163|nr:hypothetical protein [Mycobacteroides abscessus]SKM36637.1 Uncharacterised protein [Mycobacteroides abscessus subsp. abscessus]
MEYSNPDPDIVRRANAPAANPTTATRGGDAATQIGTANAKVAGVTSGTTPERLGGDAVAIRQRVSAIADAATKPPLIRAEIARAFATFNSVAPTPEQLAAAEKAVTDTAAASTAANTAADAPGATKADQDAADAAGKAAADAKKALADLVAQRKTARDALFEALRAAAKKVKEIKVSGDRDHGGGKEMPGTPTTGSGTPAGKPTTTGSGTPAATPGAKAPGSATPAAAAPKTTTSGTTGVDPDTATLAAALTKGQQNQQMPTMPTVPQQSAQPAAAAQQQPQAQQQPKQDGKDGKHGLNTDGILSTDDIARAIGENTGPMLTTAYTPGASSPINAGPTTQLRPSGTPFPGTTSGGTPAQAAPTPTTGTSRTDLVTNQGNAEVGGRPQGTENRAFSATPDGSAQTKLSAGDPANQSAAQQGRPGTGGGMPMSPMMAAPGALSSPPPSNQKADGDKDKILQRNGYHGEDTIAEAVPGGTIAQNRPSRRDAA